MRAIMENIREFLHEEAARFGVQLDDTALDKFMLYKDMLKEWNERINLTAITDDEGIVVKHFLDSLLCFKTGAIKPGGKLMDIGNGAGLPGLALKIAEPSLTVYLMDSVRKKLKFIEEAVKALQLDGVELLWGRAEDYGTKKEYREVFDAVTARAVAALPVLAEYCLPFVKIGGHALCMKGPDVDEELAASQKAVKTLGGNIKDVLRAELPYSGGSRCIVVIEKTKLTPASYPRKAGIPAKKPIR